MVARLSIRLFGPLQVTLDGETAGFESDKVRALLAYLAVESESPHRREKLAGLLWPDWPEQSARNNLRHTLAVLRKTIGDHEASPPFLLVTRQTVQFNTASDAWVDGAAFGVLLQPSGQPSLERWEKATRLYQGDFLEGFSLPDSAAFEEWVLQTREQYRRQAMEALQRVAEEYGERGEYERALEYAWRQTELDPWREEAHRQVMRLLAQSGRRSEALAQYKTCRRLLAEELGVEPAGETTRLYEQIREGELVGPMPRARRPERAPEPPPFLEAEELEEVERPVFVARERELAQLEEYLDQALAGRGRVVFVTGDAGSGKTALIQEFSRRAQADHINLVVAGGQGNAHTGVGDPYLPFREVLGLLSGEVEAQWSAGAMTREQALRLWHLLPLAVQALVKTGPDLIDTFVPGTTLLERAAAYATHRTEWLARLEELVERKVADPIVPSTQQSDLFEQYTRVLQALAQQCPLLLALDDVQWTDLGSLNLLFHLGRELAGSQILIMAAYRPEEVAIGRKGERHPLESVVNEFQRTFGDMTVNLGHAETREFLEALLDSEPNRLGDAFRDALYMRTHGHPLFTVELLRGMQERGDLVRDGDGRWIEGPALDWEMLPARVEAVVAERIGRLPKTMRELLSIASVEGEMFTAEVAARVQTSSEVETIRRLSETLDRQHRLVSAQGIRRLGGQRLSQYRFRHILFQKYLYSILDQVERVYLHEQVGTAVEELYTGQEILVVAVQLARHFEEAGITEKAIHYLYQAGERAVQLSAYQEGVAYLDRGLALLMALPDSDGESWPRTPDQRLDRAQQELALQLALGTAWIGSSSPAPAWRKAFSRARELCHQMGKTSELCRVLGELSLFDYVRAEHRRARELAEEALSVAERAGNPLLVALGHWFVGVVLFSLGEYTTAHNHLRQMISFYDPKQHHRLLVSLRGSDAGLSALAYDACCLWCLGYPEQAMDRSQEALALARALGHPFSLADALCYGGCMFHMMRRDAQALKNDAEELMRLSLKTGFPGWSASGTCYRGKAMAMLGQIEEGISQIREGMTVHRSLGGRCYLPASICNLAEAEAGAGHPGEGLTTLVDALVMVEETGERHWEAELYRVQGKLLLMQRDEAQAEASLQHAIKVARRQQARSWELRATTRLAGLWQRQGKVAEARQVLAEVYGWFTEGFDTTDLLEAKALLDDLSEGGLDRRRREG